MLRAYALHTFISVTRPLTFPLVTDTVTCLYIYVVTSSPSLLLSYFFPS